MARDKADVWAEALVASLLETGGLELVSRSSRGGLENMIAAQLARGDIRPSAVADTIMRFVGVSELHVEDAALDELMRRTQPTNAEVAVSDAAALVIQQAMTKRVEPAPLPSPLARLAPDTRAVIDAARTRARRAAHQETTLDHVLAEMLARPKIVELAKRRGGRPEEAKSEVEARLARLKSGGAVVAITPPLGRRVLEAIADAEEIAPRFVSIGDLALAAMRFDHDPHPLFVVAFGHRRPGDGRGSEPTTAVSPTEIGPFPISSELTAALPYLFPRENERVIAQRALVSAGLPAHIVAETELALETCLPEDFWAAAASSLSPFAEIGVASLPPHAEPAEPEEVGEVVLTAMSDAESSAIDLEIDGTPLVAFIDLSEGEEFLCVRRGVSHAACNHQPVFRVGPRGTKEYESFGAWVLAVSRER